MTALVGPEELRAELGRAQPLLLDVRWTLAGPDREGYRAAHLPGAVFCDLDAHLADPPGPGGRHPLPSPGRLLETFRRLGVRPGRSVVVYDGGVAAAAARAWWCLRWVGHEDVRVLDGGLPAWEAAGGELESGEVLPAAVPALSAGADGSGSLVPSGVSPATAPAPSATEGTTVPAPSATHAGTAAATAVDGTADPSAAPAVSPAGWSGGMLTVGAEEIAAGRVGVLLDARAAERFRGEAEPVDPVAGHIPGARSLPTARLLDADGRYLSGSVLRELFAAAGAGGEGPVAAYCGSGVTAAQLVLAAHEAGISAALYPGSWSHWITDPSHPVATGGR